MVRELSKEFDITFVESLGLRRPQMNILDALRMYRRLTGKNAGSSRSRDMPANVQVVSPRVVPNHAAPWRWINSLLLRRYYSAWRRSARRIYWTYSPVTYGYESIAEVAVYHCVDLYGSFPGIDTALVDGEERRLAATGVVAVGSSEVVVEHLLRQGFKTVLYWPNVADTEEILRALPPRQSQRSGALFAGNLTEKKVDFDVLKRLLMEGVQLHLAGPVAEGGGGSKSKLDQLIGFGAVYHGMLNLEELSLLMVQCKVGLIPYQINPYTRGVSPLKTYEYLAAGLSVVSTPLPGVDERKPYVHVCTDTATFVAQAKKSANDEFSDLDEKIQIAEEHSWTGRGETARSTIRDLLSKNQAGT
jgi:glycosyltransferase involved in cell wall biosynthesis